VFLVSAEVPPIHLINMDRSSDRLSRFREINGHLSGVVRVAAVDGCAISRGSWEASRYLSTDLSSYKPGTLGCAISHIKLWEVAARENRPLTVLEDDVAVARHFETAAASAIAMLPSDWDFIKWGWTINPLFAWLDVGVSRVRLQGYGKPVYDDKESIKTFQDIQTSCAPVRMLHSFGLFAYSISPKGAQTALEYCLPLRKRLINFPDAGVTVEANGIDVLLCGAYPQMQAFVALPSLVVHADEESSIRKTMDAAPA
jgi:GR25 family glycosyltransferase involved in LPS biosynthesis